MSKIFLFVTGILAAFISVSGFASVRAPSDLPVHLAFAPVTLYLLLQIISVAKNQKNTPEVTFRGRKFQLTILGLLYVALIFLGFRAATAVQSDTPPSPAPLVFTGSKNVEQSTPLTVTVYHSDPQALINIRATAATSSALIDRVPVGTTFKLLASDSGWLNILSTDNQSAWIHSDYASVSAARP